MNRTAVRGSDVGATFQWFFNSPTSRAPLEEVGADESHSTGCVLARLDDVTHGLVRIDHPDPPSQQESVHPAFWIRRTEEGCSLRCDSIMLAQTLPRRREKIILERQIFCVDALIRECPLTGWNQLRQDRPIRRLAKAASRNDQDQNELQHD